MTALVASVAWPVAARAQSEPVRRGPRYSTRSYYVGKCIARRQRRDARRTELAGGRKAPRQEIAGSMAPGSGDRMLVAI
jgi:hypothetical protein